MAANNLDAAEAQWREQFMAMKAALADLNLPGDGIDMLNGELNDEDFEGSSSGSNGNDVWDYISNEDEVFSSDDIEADNNDDTTSTMSYGMDWLISKCFQISSKSGVSPEDFQSQVVDAITSARTDEELQTHLTDVVGFNDFDFIIELLSHKYEILSAVPTQKQQEPVGKKLLSKAQREQALHQQDLQHKTASLAPAQTRAPQYPHVYRAYNAGNTLSHSGQKYGLPAGSERKSYDKYEEMIVPKGRKGVLGPGEKLVAISQLDGMCRETFKGYKELNRMQSLVFPVAYKSNENMLICAPTGAVSLTSLTRLLLKGMHANVQREKPTPPCCQSSMLLDSTLCLTPRRTLKLPSLPSARMTSRLYTWHR